MPHRAKVRHATHDLHVLTARQWLKQCLLIDTAKLSRFNWHAGTGKAKLGNLVNPIGEG